MYELSSGYLRDNFGIRVYVFYFVPSDVCLGFLCTNTIANNFIGLGGRAYPVRHYPIAIRLRDREGRTILCVVLIPQSGDSLGTTLGVRSVALLHLGLLHGAQIQSTREGNLNNRTFLVAANLLLLLDVKLTIASNKKRIKK